MNDSLQSIHLLMEGLLIPAILSTAATVIYTIKNGWRGLKNFAALWCISCFSGVCAHWGIEGLDFNPSLEALIISMAALLSHTILDVLLHPDVREAIKSRLLSEIRHRGVNTGPQPSQPGHINKDME